MSKEVLMLVEAMANEKFVDKLLIFESLEIALAYATNKRLMSNGNGQLDIKVVIDRKSGEYETFKRLTIVNDDDLVDENVQITLSSVQNQDSNLSAGDVIEELMESIKFGRIAIQTARRVIIQKIQEAGRKKTIDYYHKQIGKMLSGVVKKVGRDGLVVSFNEQTEGFIPRSELIPHEHFRINDSIKSCLVGVNDRVPLLSLSRCNKNFIINLFEREVVEMADGIVRLEAVARDPVGARAKLAVSSKDKRLDPVGACVGIRGSRVQAISSELRGERIDLVLWDDEPVQFVINSLSPVEVLSIVVDEDEKSMEVAVKDEQLAQAIGRNGQNVRLSSDLTGWKLTIMSKTSAIQQQQERSDKYAQDFAEQLDIDIDLGKVLSAQGFTSFEEIAYVGEEDLTNLDNFDEDIVKAVQQKAKDILLIRELSDTKFDDDNLSNVKGVTQEWDKKLKDVGILGREQLAEQSIDELQSVIDIDNELAGQFIMAAREHWFEKE